jgi:hypothetical protein
MPNPVPIRYSGDGFAAPINVYDGAGSVILTVTEAGAARIGKTGGTVGFYGTTPIALQTGVAVTAGGIHAALVALGLITA